MAHTTEILGANGKPLNTNGKPRPELIQAMLAQSPLSARANLSYDAARDTTEFANHWANADALDANSANSMAVRHKLIRRSRYEAGSNGVYAGIIQTHVNMVVGTGPTIRMLTGSRNFNQLVEREFYAWTQAVNLNEKLWCMDHARVQDGEAFGILTNNPEIRNGVQLDLTLIEAEQCQTPYLPANDPTYTDGIKRDENGNIQWYDILVSHPGAEAGYTTEKPMRIPPSLVVHWYRPLRPGQHRGIPSLTSTLNLGATARRMTEATVAAVETAADLNVMLTTQLTPDTANDPVAPFSSIPAQKRMLTAAPMGWSAEHFRSEHPNATYADFVRGLISQLASPIGQPYNVAAKDSSTYSFASGKLDTLCYRAAIDVERQALARRVLDQIFAMWFREWTILSDRRDIPPAHQWDWPSHPVIDDVADANAIHQRLADRTLSYRQAFSDKGQDIEDQLTIQAEDAFGEATDETILKARQIMVLSSTPQAALPYVAQILGVEMPAKESATPADQPEPVGAA